MFADCLYPEFIGTGPCTSPNYIAECDFDGGDCDDLVPDDGKQFATQIFHTALPPTYVSLKQVATFLHS